MRSLVFALFVFGTIPFILTRPYLGLLLWSWITYMNPHRLTYGWAVSFPWVELAAIITLISVAISHESKKVRPSATVILILVFFCWTTVTTAFAIEPASAWAEWERFGKNLVMVLVTFMLVKDKVRLNWLIWIIVISLGFWGFKGGVFTVLHGGHYHVYGPDRSYMQNNNDLAAVLCMALPLLRYLQLQATKRCARIALGFVTFMVGIGVLGTYSRGGLIALAAVVAMLLLKSRRRFVLLVAALMLAVTAYHFMPTQWLARMDTLHHAEQTDSAQTRIQSWKFAANYTLHHPLLGGGFNLYQNPSAWTEYAPAGSIERAVHSIYFRVLGEQGIPGIVLFVALLVVMWRNCAYVRRATRGFPEDKWAYDLASMLQVTLVAYMVAESAGTLSYFDLIYQLMAVCVLLKQLVSDKSSRPKVGSTALEGRSYAASTSAQMYMPHHG